MMIFEPRCNRRLVICSNHFGKCDKCDRTEWSPIRSVIIRKSSQVVKERENLHKKTDIGGVKCSTV